MMEEAYKRMVKRFASIGLERWETDKAIENKKTAFNRACQEFKNIVEKIKKSEESKPKHAAQKNCLPKN